MSNAPIHGCHGCATTAGRMGCSTHGGMTQSSGAIPISTPVRRLPANSQLCPKCLGSCVQSAPPGILPGQPFTSTDIGPWVCTMCYGTGYVVVEDAT